jgi:uncharacterized protein (UPF0179 family)
MLTVIGKRLAKEGLTFIFIGSLSDCKECKVKNICFHLEQGRRYKILDVRDVLHECPVHEEGVVVIEVEELMRDIIIPEKQAIEGSTITIKLPKCIEKGCDNYQLCLPVGLNTGQKKKVLKVGAKVKCKTGDSRTLVELD